MLRTVRNVPIVRLWGLAQVGMLARRHLNALTGPERRRLIELGRRPHRLTPEERTELKNLAAKLEPRVFAQDAARQVAPFGGRRRWR